MGCVNNSLQVARHDHSYQRENLSKEQLFEKLQQSTLKANEFQQNYDPPGRISDRVIVYIGCTTRSLKFQMPPLLLISRWGNRDHVKLK